MNSKSKVIGYKAIIEGSGEGVYLSLGTYNEESDCDNFGVSDNYIYYYLDGEEARVGMELDDGIKVKELEEVTAK